MEGGKILAWGCEPKSCGDLGLGQPLEVLKNDGSKENGMDIILSKSTEIKLEGHALAIAAGGWQSAAIITTEKEDKEEKE